MANRRNKEFQRLDPPREREQQSISTSSSVRSMAPESPTTSPMQTHGMQDYTFTREATASTPSGVLIAGLDTRDTSHKSAIMKKIKEAVKNPSSLPGIHQCLEQLQAINSPTAFERWVIQELTKVASSIPSQTTGSSITEQREAGMPQGSSRDSTGVNAYTEGTTLLHKAAFQGNIREIEKLLNQGALVDLPVTEDSLRGKTPLHLASEKGHVEAIKLLIKHGADPYKKAGNGSTAIDEALKWLKQTPEPIAAMLASLKLSPDNGPGSKIILEIMERGSFELITSMLEQKNIKFDLALNTQKQTPLHIAAMHNNARVVKYLLERGAKVDTKDEQGLYPIALATKDTMMGVLGKPTEDIAVKQQQQPPQTKATPAELFEAMIYFQDPEHKAMFKGKAQASYDSPLLKDLIASMARRGQKEQMRIIGSSDQSILNATVIPGASARMKQGIKGWTPENWNEHFEGHRAYFSAGDRTSSNDEKWGTVLHESTHSMMQAIFKNVKGQGEHASAPFEPGKEGANLREKFLKIVAEVKAKVDTFPEDTPDQKTAKQTIKDAFNEEGYDESSFPGELIVRVPHILGSLGNTRGEQWLQEHVSSLLKYWQEEIIPRLKSYAESST